MCSETILTSFTLYSTVYIIITINANVIYLIRRFGRNNFLVIVIFIYEPFAFTSQQMPHISLSLFVHYFFFCVINHSLLITIIQWLSGLHLHNAFIMFFFFLQNKFANKQQTKKEEKKRKKRKIIDQISSVFIDA